MQSADVLRAAIMAAVTSLVSLTVLFGLSLSAEQLAGITVAVNNVTVLAFLFVKWPNGKEPHA